MKSLIQKLVETHAPSGYEAPIRKVIRAEIETLSGPFKPADIQTDALGNLIVRKAPDGLDGKRIMLAAHMDEIGVIATHIDDNGFVRFTRLGGVRPHTLPGGRVRFLNGAAGVIGWERLEHPGDLPDMEDTFIDFGASSRKTCPVQVGDVGVFERPLVELGSRLTSKAMDDRIGVTVLIETLRRLENTPHEVFFVFSVQEEVGVRGAATAAYGVDPQLGIAVDVTASGDTPNGFKMETGLGKGPAIKVRDSGMLSDPRVVSWMVKTAENSGLPYQLEVLEMGSTDARAIQLSRAGVPAGCISIPCRYIHTPSEVVDISDVENAVQLLSALLSAPVAF